MDEHLLALVIIIILLVLLLIGCVTLLYKCDVFTIGKRQKSKCDEHEEVKNGERQAPNNEPSHSPTTANGQDDRTSTATLNNSTTANLDAGQYSPTSDVPASKKQKVFSRPTELQPLKQEVKGVERERSGEPDVQIQMESLIRDVVPGPSEELQEPEASETGSASTTCIQGNQDCNIKKDQTMFFPLRQPCSDSSPVDQETDNKILPKDSEKSADLHPEWLDCQPSAFPKDLEEDESGCDTLEKGHIGSPEEYGEYTGTEIFLPTKTEVNNPQMERERKFCIVVENLKNKILQDAWENADKTLYKNMGWKTGFITTSFRKNLEEYDDIMRLSLNGMPPLQIDVYTMWMRGYSPPDMSRCQVCNIRPPGSTCVGCGRRICDQRECVEHTCRDRVDKAFV